MNTTQTYVKRPIIGKVQHGEKLISDDGKSKTVDYGYFIAKIQENNMQPYLDKFNRLIKGSKSIDIQFLDDNPLSIRQERANQSGRVCYCMEGQNKGKQKIKNLWQDIECKSDCTYLQKDKNGKTQCKRIAWLKFLIPQVATDRLWLMKITGQEAIENLKAYIQVQKLQGNSLKNTIFTLFLTQKEQVNGLGQVFNNYILDILQKSDFISQTSNSNNLQEPPINQNKTLNNVVESSNTIPSISNSNTTPVSSDAKPMVTESTIYVTSNKKQPTKTTEVKSTSNNDTKTKQFKDQSKTPEKETTTNKKETKSKSKKEDETPQEPKGEYDNCYVLLGANTENLQNKEYFVAEFVDMQDKTIKVAIHPDFVAELSECELGTVVKLNIQKVQEINFAVGLEFVEKYVKKVVA